MTLWTDSTELFMEYPWLIVGQPAKFSVHLTDLTDFAPLRSGKVTFGSSPREGAKGFRWSGNPARAGHLWPRAGIPETRVWNLTITVESPQAHDVLSVPGLHAYATSGDTAGQRRVEREESPS